MTEITKETITTQGNVVPTVTRSEPPTDEASSLQTVEYVMYFLLGLLELLLVFRLVLKMMGASTASGFVSFIYTITGVFILPFEGIFSRWFTQGVETTSVFEPSTLVAMIVYALLVWGLVKLIHILSGKKQQAE